MKYALAATLFALTTACGAAQDNSAAAQSHQHSQSTLEVHHAWAAPTPGGVDVSAGYLTISNHTQAQDRLVSASSPRAARIEVHEMSMDGGVMRMRPMEALVIPAGGEVALSPGGAHLMFYGVREPFVQGQTIPVRLTFANAGAVDVTLTVQRAAPATHNH